MAETYDHQLKLVLVGDSPVGKTCLLRRFSKDVFPSDVRITVGANFENKTIEIDGKKIKLQIWDTAGVKMSREIIRMYYSSADGIIVVYDVTNQESFDNTRDWIREIEEHAPADVVKIVLGNKCDMNDERKVSREEGEKLAMDYGIKFLETSAKSGISVEEAFFTLTRDIMSRPDMKMQGSHTSWKTWKTWKVIDQFFSRGKHMENEKK